MVSIYKNRLILVVVLVMLLTLCLPIAGFAAEGNSTQDLGAPTVSKTLTPNGDGTYELAINITGKSKASTSSTKADVIVIFDKSNSMNDRIGNETRLKIAKRTVNTLVTQLLNNNTTQEPDRVHISLITFATRAQTIIEDSSNKTNFINTVNAISAPSDFSGGTNWEDAFQAALKVKTRPGAERYVVFVSDGDPTFRNSHNGYKSDNKYYRSYGVYGTGTNNQASTIRCYNASTDEALALHEKGFNFFGIGIFGDSTRMRDIVIAADEDPSTNSFQANNEAGIKEAFNYVVQTITNNFGYKDVKLSDMVTSLTSMVQTSGNTGDFRYARSGGVYGSGTPWTTGPKATISQGEVKWDLSSLGTLEDNVTYSVKFTVWPSQRAYDIAAALDNGEISHGQNSEVNNRIVTNKEWSEITPDGRLKTNETASAKYKQVYIVNGVEVSSTPGEVIISNPEPIPLTTTKLKVNKKWEDSSVGTGDRPKSITLEVLQDGKKFKDITLNNPNWSAELTLSPGLLVDGNKYGANSSGVLIPGHTYTLVEKSYVNSENITVNGVPDGYELSTEECHPMLNGKTVGTTDDLIDLISARKWANNLVSLTATNTSKGQIEINKKLIGDNTDLSTFNFTTELRDSNNEPIFSPNSLNTKVIKGAIYDSSGNLVSVHPIKNGQLQLGITKDQKIRILNVPSGTKYKVRETPTPGFSQISIEGAEGTVTGNKKVSVNVTNRKDYGEDEIIPVNITLTKKDALSGNVISADKNPATFEVFQSNQSVGQTKVVNGEISYQFTDPGTYMLKEIMPPTGYTINDESFEVKVNKIYDGTHLDSSTNTFVRKYHLETNLQNDNIDVYDYPEMTKVEITKEWNDRDYFEAVEGYSRPSEVTIMLIGSAGAYTESYEKTITAESNWKAIFNNLPKYRDGMKINYRATEESITGAGFTLDVSKDGRVITNTPRFSENDVYNPVKIYINKTDANTDKSIPMTADNKAVFEVFQGSNNLGTTSFDNGRIEFSFNKSGKYKLREIVAPTGYDVTSSKEYTITVSKGEITKVQLGGNVFTRFWNLLIGAEEDFNENSNMLTVSNVPQTTDISGEKIWNDLEYFEKVEGYERPDSITINLLADNQLYESRTIKATNNWRYKFSDLPTVKDGKEIKYSIEEVDIPGYTSQLKGNNFENTPITETVIEPKELIIQKIDNHTKDPLKGAVFAISSNELNSALDTEATDSDGKTTVTFTKPGTYKIKEKVAPEGYLLNEMEFTVVVKEGDLVLMEKKNNVFIKHVLLSLDSNDIEDDVLRVEDVSIGTVKIKKEIDNYRDSLSNDEFMIKVDSLEGENVNTNVVLKSGETSGTILIHEPTTLYVEEIMPASYAFKDMYISGNKSGPITDKRVTVEPGDDVIIHVINQYEWVPYFHGFDTKLNKFAH